MNGPSSPPKPDGELLQVTRAVFAGNGFHVGRTTQNIDLILAENNYFIVAVAAMNTIGDLVRAEPLAVEALGGLTESASLGPKKWDTYLVLLTQERSAEDDKTTRDLYAINYDTSRLRRIAHTGVDPTEDAVTHALAPFLEPSPSATASQDDAFESLLRTLVLRGVDEELASRAITAFEQGATLDDVL